MRSFLVFTISSSLALAGPWEDFVEAHRASPTARARWSLVVKPSLLAPKDLLADADYQKLASGDDWGIEALSAPALQDLQSTHGAQWALLSPKGDVAAWGRGSRRAESSLRSSTLPAPGHASSCATHSFATTPTRARPGWRP